MVIQDKITEKELTFSFDQSQQKSTKYDDWSFYRKHFEKISETKAVDIVCIDRNKRCTWLIEIKDYSVNKREKSIALSMEIAQKVRDTISGLYVASKNAYIKEEKDFAYEALEYPLRIVLHWEQYYTLNTSVLKTNRANMKMKLKTLLKLIDNNPSVEDIDNTTNWDVARSQSI